MEQKKIFISHSSLDTQIGEKFVDALIELGVDKDLIFYSSRYHTGVEIGKDFHSVIKNQLKNCEIVVFLLTRNFYQSPACLNEMGAAWMLEKNILPILLDNLKFSDMKGFIDSHYIAYEPKTREEYKLLTKFNPYITTRNVEKTLEEIFKDFVSEANRLSAFSSQYIEPNKELSGIEEDILNKRFTDKEIILLNYFIEIEDYSFSLTEETGFLKYAKEYSGFNHLSALDLLEKSGYIEYWYDSECFPDQDGNIINSKSGNCEIDISIFRNLISLGVKGREYIEAVKSKYRKNIVETRADRISTNLMDDYILNPEIRELEVLLISYMYDTATITLGDRWMAEGTINNIIAWQTSNDVNDKLSRNYNTALRILNAKGILEPSNFTSYGNVKEFALKAPYSEQILKISTKSQELLNATKKANYHNSDDDLPF